MKLLGDKKTYIVAKIKQIAGDHDLFDQYDIQLSMQLGVPLIKFYESLEWGELPPDSDVEDNTVPALTDAMVEERIW